MVTVHADEHGVRISKITPHGEEVVLDPNALVTALAVQLWQKVAGPPLDGYVPWSVEQAEGALQEAAEWAVRPIRAERNLTRVLAQQLGRLDDRVLELELQALDRPTSASPPPLVDPGGR